jgi:hypothetical protein
MYFHSILVLIFPTFLLQAGTRKYCSFAAVMSALAGALIWAVLLLAELELAAACHAGFAPISSLISIG